MDALEKWTFHTTLKQLPSQNGCSSKNFSSNHPCCYKWLVRHFSIFLQHQRRPLPSLLSSSSLEIGCVYPIYCKRWLAVSMWWVKRGKYCQELFPARQGTTIPYSPRFPPPPSSVTVRYVVVICYHCHFYVKLEGFLDKFVKQARCWVNNVLAKY